MNELNTLIQQTKEEIENIEKEYLDFCEKYDKVNEVLSGRSWKSLKKKLWTEIGYPITQKRNTIPELKAKLSALQTAQELFIKIVDNMTAMDIVNNSEIGKSRLDAVKKYLKSQLLKDGGDASHPQTPNGRGSS